MLPMLRAIGDNITPINAAVVDSTLSAADELAQKIAESGIDLSNSGLRSISDEAKVSLFDFLEQSYLIRNIATLFHHILTLSLLTLPTEFAAPCPC